MSHLHMLCSMANSGCIVLFFLPSPVLMFFFFHTACFFQIVFYLFFFFLSFLIYHPSIKVSHNQTYFPNISFVSIFLFIFFLSLPSLRLSTLHFNQWCPHLHHAFVIPAGKLSTSINHVPLPITLAFSVMLNR